MAKKDSFRKSLKKEEEIKKLRVNRQIKAYNVRLIDESGKQLGIVPLKQALEVAEAKGLDLVEIVPEASPPVCKILDWGRYQYEQKKKAKKQKSKMPELKQLRISFNISPHDLETKLKQGRKFLEKKHKLKILMILKGREIIKDREAEEKLKIVAAILEDIAEIEEGPKKLNPRFIYLILKPKKI